MPKEDQLILYDSRVCFSNGWNRADFLWYRCFNVWNIIYFAGRGSLFVFRDSVGVFIGSAGNAADGVDGGHGVLFVRGVLRLGTQLAAAVPGGLCFGAAEGAAEKGGCYGVGDEGEAGHDCGGHALFSLRDSDGDSGLWIWNGGGSRRRDSWAGPDRPVFYIAPQGAGVGPPPAAGARLAAAMTNGSGNFANARE